MDTLFAIGSILLSAYLLFQHYITGRVRLTFRAGCLMWLLLVFGISTLFGFNF